MAVYIIVGEGFDTFGVFRNEEDAQKRLKEAYANGYFGELNIIEDEIY